MSSGPSRAIDPTYKHLYSWCPVAPGDVWEIAGHRLLCADFREAPGYGYMKPLLPDGPCSDMMCTPPGTKGHAQLALRKAGLGVRTINWDDWIWRLLEISELGASGNRILFARNQALRSRIYKWAGKRGVIPWRGDDESEIHLGCTLRDVEWSRPASLFDPCVGDAREHRRFVREGTRLHGIELIPRKCAVTLYNLWVWTGGGKRPERVY